jgi:hypothetical protein
MSLFLFLLGITLVAVGILWRLSEIEVRSTAGPPRVGTGRAAEAQRSSAPKFLPRTLKAAGAKVAGTEATYTTAPSAMAQRLRRSDRVLLRIPLEVSGTNLEGNTFTERTHTQDVNRNGASIVLRNSFLPGGQMTVKNLQTSQSCRFRACRASQDLPGGLREWGVECLDPAPNFWGITFAVSPEDASLEEENVSSLLECTICHCRELAKVTLSEYRAIVQRTSSARFCVWCGTGTEWKFAIVEEGAGARASEAPKGQEVAASLGSVEEVRLEDRRIVRLPISIRHQDGREEFTITENVSSTGVCCAANMELNTGDRVFVRFVSDQGPGEVEFPAQIMWRRTLNEKRGILYGMKLQRDPSRAA